MKPDSNYNEYASCLELSEKLEKLFVDEFWTKIQNEQISDSIPNKDTEALRPFSIYHNILSQAKCEDEIAWIKAVLIIHFANLGCTIKKGMPYFYDYLGFVEDTASDLKHVFFELIDILSKNLSFQKTFNGFNVYGNGKRIFEAINDVIDFDSSFMDNITVSDAGFEMRDRWDELSTGNLTDKETYSPTHQWEVLSMDELDSGLGNFLPDEDE